MTAGLLNQDKTPIADASSSRGQERAMKLVDVGIGCGDQSLYLTSRLSKMLSSKTQERKPLFDSYVGVTIAQSQADFARERLLENSTFSPSTTTTPKAQIFAANAADPISWNPELTKATNTTTKDQSQTWLLALDTLYHFTPSRKPLLKHAYQELQASFMAFDLLLSDTPSFWDKLRMRAICLVAGMPFSNLLTKKGYEDMLVEVGYERGMIEMRDVSEDVFGGIAGYIREKDAELGRFGMGVGKFKGPAKVFDWWARSGVIRGFVVVARRGEGKEE